MPNFYQNKQVVQPRIAPSQPDVQVVDTTATGINTEFFYPAADVVIPLLPEGYIDQGVLVPYVLSDALGNPIPQGAFIDGEPITADVAGARRIQLLTFAAVPPDPGFVRGELITDITGATGIVARRYATGNRYLVYDVNLGGGWGGGTTGAGGGGGTVAGLVTAVEDYGSIYDSYARRARNLSGDIGSESQRIDVHLIRDCNFFAPPGSWILGTVSGTLAQVTAFNPPNLKAQLSQIIFQFDSFDDAAAFPAYGIATLLVGDLAQLMNVLAPAPATAQDAISTRMARKELIWTMAQNHQNNDAIFLTENMGRMIVTGRWKNSTVYNFYGEQYCDGMVLRVYGVAGKGGAAPPTPFIHRRIDYQELWNFMKNLRI